MKKKMLMVLVSAVLVGGLFPALASSQEAPSIQLLNPSDYTTPVELSTKTDSNNTYHFVAWVPEVPPSPFVEFEIKPAAGNATTIEATRVGATDTWEATHNLAGLADGAYTVEAILYSNGLGFGMPDSQAVTINNSDLPLPPQAETVEITYPANGGALGFFSPPASAPRAIIDVATSEDAAQVRAFYTKSAVGTDPEWAFCGSGSPSGGTARVRCTLNEGDTPGNVRAIAAVANLTPPPAAPQAAADESGDAHRVSTYISSPTRVVITPGSVKQNVGTCLALTAQVQDQMSRPVQGANVDVHASGPTDNLQFGSISNTTSAFKAPDKGPHGTENALDCSDNSSDGQQGDTNRVPGADEKHIESTTGTNNSGNFTFALRSTQAGGTQVVAFADENDDDLHQFSEASGGAQIGWGQDPPQPETQIFLSGGSAQTVGNCARMTLTIREGGNPQIGVNADIHLSGSGASFCTVSGGTTLTQPSDAEHTAGTHSDGTQHSEGQTNDFGQVIFGVSSATEGDVSVLGWLDETDDDILSGEPSTTATVSFTLSGDRDVSFDTSKRRTAKGRRVRFFGQIDGADACSAGQKVVLKARRPGARFKTIKTKTTNDEGNYSWRFRVYRTRDYRVIAPKDGVCERDRSRTLRVRVRR